jgi:hypothetical protein
MFFRKDTHMKVALNKDRNTKWKIAICVMIFIFGAFIAIASLASFSFQTSEYQTINCVYSSYRKDSGYRTVKAYITVETNDAKREEYIMDSVVLPSFKETAFLNAVGDGDYIELTVDGDEIVSINADGISYLSLEEASKENRDNAIVGFVLGSTFVLVSLAALSTQITVKGRKRRHRR